MKRAFFPCLARSTKLQASSRSSISHYLSWHTVLHDVAISRCAKSIRLRKA